MSLETERLLLRPWRAEDREPFGALNADLRVMELFPAPLTREQSDAMVDRIEAGFQRDGWGLWAVEVRDVADFIGFVGLARPRFETAFTPCVEVGWRLASDHWGKGYASEGAAAALAAGFGPGGLEEIVSFTSTQNVKSRRVMEKLGMTHDPADDFDHPTVPSDWPLRRHVLYRLGRPDADAGPVHWTA